VSSDAGELAAWAESQGWTIKVDSKQYLRFFDPDGNYIARYPATPGNSYRRMNDLTVALKRAGLQIPPPSKKEQRAARHRKETDQ
jgi:hypothetical protein